MSERGRHHRLTGQSNRGSPWPWTRSRGSHAPRLFSVTSATPAAAALLCSHAPMPHAPCPTHMPDASLRVLSSHSRFKAPRRLLFSRQAKGGGGMGSGTSVRVHARCSALSEARVNEERFPSPRRVAAASASRRRRRRRAVARQVSIGGYVVAAVGAASGWASVTT